MAIICSQCGTQLPDDAAFCLKCGRPIASKPVVKLSEEQQRYQFFNAVQAGEVVKARDLLEQNSSLTVAIRYDERTALHLAAEKGNKAMAQLLIEYGADVNAVSGHWLEESPLFIAVTKRYTDIVELLLDHGARVYLKGRSLLHEAIEQKNIVMVRLLLDHGADVDEKNPNPQNADSPLHAAIQGNNTAIAKLLIERGADVNTRGSNNDTPLHAAIHKKLPDIVKLLLEKGANVNLKDNYQSPPMSYGKDDPTIYALLKAHGAKDVMY